MPSLNKREVIEIAYHIFAMEGPAHVNERVAHEVHLKKSECQDRFGQEEDFIDELILHHIELANEFLSDAGKCKSWDPEFIELLVHFKTTVLFNRQLKLHSD